MQALPVRMQMPAGVGRHVGARLVDHGDQAQRHAHAGQVHTARKHAVVEHAADGIGQLGELLQTGGHALDALRRQQQTVEQTGEVPASRAADISSSLAATMESTPLRSAAAMARTASWRCSSLAVASEADAALAATARSWTYVAISTDMGGPFS